MLKAHTKHSRGTSHLHLTVAQLWKSWEPLVAGNTHGSLADTMYLRVVVTFQTAPLHTDAHSLHKAQQRNTSPPSDCCKLWKSWEPLVGSNTHGSLADTMYLRVVVTFQTAPLHTDAHSLHKVQQSNMSCHLYLTVPQIWRSWEPLVARKLN